MLDNLPAKVSKSLFTKEEEVAMNDFLPSEILPNILLRLPTKSIVKFTSVCKTWRSLIRNPDFISAHLKLSNHNQPLLLFRFCSDGRLKRPYLDYLVRDTDEKEVYKLYCDNQDFNEHARFDFPFHTLGRTPIFRVVGTCNGLVCVEDDGLLGRIILWNPCVRMFVELPTPSITYQGYHEEDGYGYDAATGLGFDSKTNDYKVVRVVTVVDVWRRSDCVSPPKVEVYSLATGEWSMVTTALPGAVHPRDPMPFVNGALHWVALRRINYFKYRNFITVLDLGDMVFREITLPILSDEKDYGNESFIYPFISAYGNSLGLIHGGRGLCLNVWLMKRYKDASSWTKIVIFPHIGLLDQAIKDIEDVGYGFKPSAKGFRKSGEVVVELGEQPFVSQDLETQECKDLPISACNYTFVGSYVKSLVLLDKPNRAATY
ncbi:F-box protein CPR1-like isoform X2 [Quercus suber]|uniref:F-box protein CPR1-like isoform X2 n=1 Tax=Quercus suber TaxID=58331 RepID=UPI0032DE7D2A